LTGKGLAYGGSLIRPEATGYGVVYFAEQMLKTINESIAGKTAVVSGFGNVAWGVIKKINDLGGKVVTISGPDGYIYDKDGISGEKLITFWNLELPAITELKIMLKNILKHNFLQERDLGK
jgi:glutamate dehydrogenase (NADP+)